MQSMNRGRQNAAGARLRCPLCRAEAPDDYDPVTAPAPLVHLMRQVFPERYAQREAQAEAAALEEGMAHPRLLLRIGNRHETVSNPQRSKNGKHMNEHRWTMFVENAAGGSRSVGEWCEDIASVKFEITPFYPQDAVLRKPPFCTTRTGWGYFDVAVTVTFKDARNVPLVVQHELCFEAGGASEVHEVQLVKSSRTRTPLPMVGAHHPGPSQSARRSDSSLGTRRPALSQGTQRRGSSQGVNQARRNWRL